MKNIKLLFALVCCFVATSFGMEEKKHTYPQHHEVYDRMINQLLDTPKVDLAKRIDHMAPEIREALFAITNTRKDAIKAGKQKCSQPIFNKLNAISAALAKSLGKSVEEETSKEIYDKNDLMRILENIIETERPEVHEKVKKFNQELKEALIEYIKEINKASESRTNKSFEDMRLLNKLNFISDALKKD